MLDITANFRIPTSGLVPVGFVYLLFGAVCKKTFCTTTVIDFRTEIEPF